MTIRHQGLAEEDWPLALTREVNLDTQSSDSSAEEIRESGNSFQSLIVTYEKYGGPYLPYVCQDGRGLVTGLWDFLSKFGQTHKQEKS